MSGSAARSESINCTYIVACFEGERPNVSTTHSLETTIERHLEALDLCDTSDSIRVDTVMFIVNQVGYDADRVNEEQRKLGDRSIKIIYRPNHGYSYGAWDHAVKALLNSGVSSGYAFLVEDDYLPSLAGFLDPFLQEASGKGFVAQSIDSLPGIAPRHATTSNGLLDLKAAEATKSLFGISFMIYPFELSASDYIIGCENQITFLSLLELANFPVVDIKERWSVPHLSVGRVLEMGVTNAPAPLRPIQ